MKPLLLAVLPGLLAAAQPDDGRPPAADAAPEMLQATPIGAASRV